VLKKLDRLWSFAETDVGKCKQKACIFSTEYCQKISTSFPPVKQFGGAYETKDADAQ